MSAMGPNPAVDLPQSKRSTNQVVRRRGRPNDRQSERALGRLLQCRALVERYTRTAPDTLQYEVTVNDPRTWTKPWKAAFPLRRESSYGIFEYACHEGNHAMSNILSASRSADKTANGGVQ